MDLIIRHARLKGREGTWDVGITGDRIVALAEQLAEAATTEVDAGGNAVMPTYVNGHIHLDKCYLQEKMRPNKDYTFGECLELTWEHKARYTVEDILERAGRAIEEGILNGTTVFRAFADVDSVGKLRGLEGLLALRERWRSVVYCFELAKRYDKDIHMLVDDTDNPLSRSLEYLAVKTMREGYQGRVSASHCGALAAYNEIHAHKVMDLLKQANVSISSNPHISLVVQGRYDQEPIRRGITRVKQLWQHGVNVFSSQDDVADPFYPFGRNDQQEVVSYICHTAHMAAPSEVEAAFDFVTYNAARALRLQNYGLEPGCKADLNVLAAATPREVLRLQRPPRLVVRDGKLLARNQVQREFMGR